jgi:hypothetical protein
MFSTRELIQKGKKPAQSSPYQRFLTAKFVGKRPIEFECKHTVKIKPSLSSDNELAGKHNASSAINESPHPMECRLL